MIRVFIGHDERETVAWHLLADSISARSSEPASVVPLALQNLKRVFWRERNALQSTTSPFRVFSRPT